MMFIEITRERYIILNNILFFCSNEKCFGKLQAQVLFANLLTSYIIHFYSFVERLGSEKYGASQSWWIDVNYFLLIDLVLHYFVQNAQSVHALQ